MTVFLIIIAVILLISLLPVGVIFNFIDGDAKVFAKIGLLKICVFPFKKQKKEKVHKKPKKKKTVTKAKKKPSKTKESPKLSLTDYFSLAANLQRQLRAKLTINKLIIYIIIASSDPFKTAMSHGKTCAFMSNAVGILEAVFHIKKRETVVCPDFLATNGRIYCELDITIRIHQIFSLGISLLIQFLKAKKKSELTQKLQEERVV